MSQGKNINRYKYIVYIFIVCHVFVNSTFSKICIILDTFLDVNLNLPLGTNLMTVALSTFFGALGKFLGIFLSGHKQHILIWTFFLNAICLLFCAFPKYVSVFIFFRTLQGFIAGLQNSTLFGLMGTLPECRNAFTNFTTISSFLSIMVIVILYFTNPKNIIIALVFINLFSWIFFWSVLTISDSKTQLKEIDWLTVKILATNKMFILKSVFLGSFLGFTLLAISQQKSIIINVFGSKFYQLSNILSSITFLASGITSFFSFAHTQRLFNLLTFACVWCIFIGIATKSLFLFLIGAFLPFSCFSIINPIIMQDLTLYSSNKFMSASCANGLRSFVTALVILIIPRLFNSVFEVSIFCIFALSLFYGFLSSKN